MSMGRPRKHRRDLPERVYFRRKTYFFVDRAGKWHNLGKDYHEAMINLAHVNTTPIPSNALTIYIDRYIRDVIPKKARSTRKEYMRQIEILRAVFGHMNPNQITPPDIYGYMDRRPDTSANREKALLSGLFMRMIEWGVVDENPCRKVQSRPEHPANRYIEDEEFIDVRAIMPAPIQKCMDIALLTGLRQGDLLMLKRQDIKPNGLLVETGKTGRKLLFEITRDLDEALNRNLPIKASCISSMWIIHNRDGQRYSSEGFRTQWQRCIKRATDTGLIEKKTRFAFKDIRAKAASDGRDDNMLGHKSMTTLYKHYKRKPLKVSPIR